VAVRLEPWLRQGGRLLIAGPTPPQFPVAETEKVWKDPDGAYFRVRNRSMFPSLRGTDVLFMYGEYRELKGSGPLTFIPPSMYGPPELVHVDWKDTSSPGLVVKAYGQGEVAWLPWEIGALYYRHSSEALARLMRDLIDRMLPRGRQLESDAHPLVEIRRQGPARETVPGPDQRQRETVRELVRGAGRGSGGRAGVAAGAGRTDPGRGGSASRLTKALS
jgi:hypothetical protein